MSQITHSPHGGSAAAPLKTSPKEKFLNLLGAAPWTPSTNTLPPSIEGRVKKPIITPAKELNLAPSHLKILTKSEGGRLDHVLQQEHSLISILTKIRENIEDQLFLAGSCIRHIIDSTQSYSVIDVRYPVFIRVEDESEISIAIQEKHEFIKENTLKNILDAFPADITPIALDEQIEDRYCILRVGNINLHICYNVTVNESPTEFLYPFSQDYLCIPLDQVLLEKQKKCTLISQMGPIAPLIHSVFERELESKHFEPRILFEWLEFTALKGYSSSSELRADIVRGYLSAFSLDELLFHFQSYFASFPVVEQRLCLALLHLVLKEYGVDNDNQFKVIPHWLPFIILKNYISTGLLVHSIIEFLNHPHCLELYQELPEELQIFGKIDRLEDLVRSMAKRTFMFLSPPERYQFYLFLLFSFESVFDSLNLQVRLDARAAYYTEENFTAFYLKNTSHLTAEECTEFLRKLERAHTPAQLAIYGLNVLKRLIDLGSPPSKLTACKLLIRKPLANTLFEEITSISFKEWQPYFLAQEMILKFVGDDLAIDIWEFVQKERILNVDNSTKLFILLIHAASLNQRERLWSQASLIGKRRAIQVLESFLISKTKEPCSFDETLITKVLQTISIVQKYPQAIIHFIEHSHLDETKALWLLRLLKRHPVLPAGIQDLFVTLLCQIKNTSDFCLYKEFKDLLGFSETRFILFQKIVNKILQECNFTDSNLMFLKTEFTLLLPQSSQILFNSILAFEVAKSLLFQPLPLIDRDDLEKELLCEKLALKHFSDALDILTIASKNISTSKHLDIYILALKPFFQIWAHLAPRFYTEDNVKQVSDLMLILLHSTPGEISLSFTESYFKFLECFIYGCTKSKRTKNVNKNTKNLLYAAEIFTKSLDSKQFPATCFSSALKELLRPIPGEVDTIILFDMYIKLPSFHIFTEENQHQFTINALMNHLVHPLNSAPLLPIENIRRLEILLDHPFLSQYILDYQCADIISFPELSKLSLDFKESVRIKMHYRMFERLLKDVAPQKDIFTKLAVKIRRFTLESFDIDEMIKINNLFLDHDFFALFPISERNVCNKFFLLRILEGTRHKLKVFLTNPRKDITLTSIEGSFKDLHAQYEKLTEKDSEEHTRITHTILLIYARVSYYSSRIFDDHCMNFLTNNPQWLGYFVDQLYKNSQEGSSISFIKLRKLFPLVKPYCKDIKAAKEIIIKLLEIHLKSGLALFEEDYRPLFIELNDHFKHSFFTEFKSIFAPFTKELS